MPVSLHTHSWYSLLEGASSPQNLWARAEASGMTALALTDTNNLYGAIPFTLEARRRGLRPLLGACLRQEGMHCVALIEQPIGYRNLCRILSRLHLDGPQTCLESSLRENAEGLHLLVEDMGLARRLREAFPGRLWLELVRPRAGSKPGRASAREQALLQEAAHLGMKPIASTGAHFATPEEYPVFRLATVVRQGGLLDQLPARLPIMPDHHLAGSQTLSRWFADIPEAVANTDRLADQLADDVLPSATILPPARVPRSLDAVGFLRCLGEQGLRRRGLETDAAARARLREELVVIEATGLSSYFLVVRDIARYARCRGHTMALRGSAGNSFVCYLLDITNVNPLRFDLGHDRFLHPGRPDLPDIDLDFDWKIRDAVIAHVFERYGPRHTAMISTHQFLQPRSAFREAAKAHGLSNDQIRQLTESMEDRIDDVLTKAWQGKDVAPSNRRGFDDRKLDAILRDGKRLLGLPRHLSVHPGGVVITPEPIEDYVPLQRAAKGVVITQFEKDAIEHIGLVKIDLLGNRALGTIDETRAQGLAPVTEEPAADIIDLLRRGDTLGVGQLESPAMRHLLIQMRPNGVEDVIAALAVVRPGAASGDVKEAYLRRRRGLETYTLHPLLVPALGANHGCMIYEDDGPRVIEALTGFSIPETYRFFKRVKKCADPAEEHALAGEFLSRCAARGVPRTLAIEQFVLVTKFRHYSFCKSHAVSYGLIAWQACAAKVRHPLTFWAAALNNNQGMYPRRVYVEAIKRSRLEVRLPCVNRSGGPFIVADGAIRTGLEAIATLPEDLRERLLYERERHGPFRDLGDLRRRIDPGPEALGCLIRCGALDFTGRPRPALFLEAELEQSAPATSPEESLFGDMPFSPLWAPPDYTPRRRLLDEWNLLGFVAGPPLLSLFASVLPAQRVLSQVLHHHIGRKVTVAGVVAAHRYTTTSDGRPMQFLSLEDETGLIELNLFPGNCPPVPHLQLGPYVATGMVEEDMDVVTVNALTVQPATGSVSYAAFG